MIMPHDIMQKIREMVNSNLSEIEGATTFRPIGTLHSAFRDRRGTPRQGCLVPHSTAFIEFFPHTNAISSLEGLEDFSHVWVLGIFHENTNIGKSGIASKIKPPRKKGEKVGIYSTRTPHRHNPISLSLAKIDKIETTVAKGKNVTRLWLSGIDLIHGTPILDIKPYIRSYDSMSEDVRVASWVEEEDTQTGFKFDRVIISEKLKEQYHDDIAPHLEFYSPDKFLEALQEILTIDIRSEYQRNLQNTQSSEQTYSCRLDTVKIEFDIHDKEVSVRNFRLP
jgi:tRNA-Thr(GGU) m(6)t(6)A37 methyltransferase TsaA